MRCALTIRAKGARMKKHGELKRNQRDALVDLMAHRSKLTRQEYRTFKGLIYKGDVAGFYKGLEKVLARKE